MSDLKLTLDLVPSSCWFSNLRVELPRHEWDRLAAEELSRAEACAACGSPDVRDVHELWEFREDLGPCPHGSTNPRHCLPVRRRQVLAGLVAICRPCHRVKHLAFAEARGELAPALEHFCRVNELDADLAMRIVRRVFEEASRRSRDPWELDLSWLADRGFDVVSLLAASRLRRSATRDGREDAKRRALEAAELERGPPPEGRTRGAVFHGCGHVTVVEVPDLESLGEVAGANVVEALEALARGGCLGCEGFDDEVGPEPVLEIPAAPREPTPEELATRSPRRTSEEVEDVEGRTYDFE